MRIYKNTSTYIQTYIFIRIIISVNIWNTFCVLTYNSLTSADVNKDELYTYIHTNIYTHTNIYIYIYIYIVINYS